MKLSELLQAVAKCPADVNAFSVLLACPDTIAADEADEQLSTIGLLEYDAAGQQVRLYPPYSARWSDESDPVGSVEELLKCFPSERPPGQDPEFLAELPLVREEGQMVVTNLVPVVAIHIGVQSEELWLLLRPPAEFAAGTLPE